MEYAYFLIQIDASPPPQVGADPWACYYAPGRLLEQQLSGLGMHAEFVDLPNTDRAYRVPLCETARLQRDRRGQFIAIGGNRFSLLLDDPTAGIPLAQIWRGINT